LPSRRALAKGQGITLAEARWIGSDYLRKSGAVPVDPGSFGLLEVAVWRLKRSSIIY
jgi:hypothetical protein